ncbi:hypothetical protein FIBSPDRAFT_855685 [Athelia psychrophila]|uniref:Uncharacterized protein n=1 Tax=Athelia psychrophila TaxID=1759441 RepID=A0A166NY79_9AGAM|nr:hypothetical protein FIBSPDRAFT_855685 [Fibularhizoctonia sp. CBS 109695]
MALRSHPPHQSSARAKVSDAPTSPARPRSMTQTRTPVHQEPVEVQYHCTCPKPISTPSASLKAAFNVRFPCRVLNVSQD